FSEERTLLPHITKVRVRFGETDMAGHVNNAVYLSYLEEARINFLRDTLEMEDTPLILASIKLDFLRQVFFREILRIETLVSRLGTSSFDVVHTIYRDTTDEPVLTAQSVLVRFNYDTQSSEPLPDLWRKRLSEVDVMTLKTGPRK
ncbi:MAG: acyl-CoA thioesterase, partial [Firmicutes bacterium]|nr:acyl-CoA thioesterase [Bacillota bacterium]